MPTGSQRNARSIGIGTNLFLTILSVLLCFTIAEIALWAFGVPTLLEEQDPFQGFSRLVRVFRRVPDQGVYVTSPAAVVHSFNPQQFTIDKPADVFRIFALGGSSAYGFPWGAEMAFTRILGDALQATYPSRSFESVNAAAMSYGSHRLRTMAHEVLELDADLLILYGGHNEFIERGFYRSLLSRNENTDWMRALLHRWRLYSAMTRMLRPAEAGRGAESLEGRTTGELLGLDVRREDASGTDVEQRKEVRERFEENIEAILALAGEREVPVILCTVPSNVRDWAPNDSAFGPEVDPVSRDQVHEALEEAQSLMEAGDPAAARAVLESAREMDPLYAETHFRLGRALEALEEWGLAKESYLAARDADSRPSRALSSINETIRRLAGRQGALLVDAEQAFEEASPHGLIGFNLIEDYVHPNPDGHRLIALEIWRRLNDSGWLGPPGTVEDARFWDAVGPEVGTLADVNRTSAWFFNMGVVFERQGLIDKAMEKYRQCLELNPRYSFAASNLGRLLNMTGKPQAAAEQFLAALAEEPDQLRSLVGLARSFVKLKRYVEAREAFTRATRARPDAPEPWNGLGRLMMIQGQPVRAEPLFRKAIDLDPVNILALSNLGFSLNRQGRFKEAIEYFRRSLEAHHEQPLTRSGLASALLAEGELDEAERLWHRNLAADPSDARAREGLSAIARRRATDR